MSLTVDWLGTPLSYLAGDTCGGSLPSYGEFGGRPLGFVAGIGDLTVVGGGGNTRIQGGGWEREMCQRDLSSRLSMGRGSRVRSLVMTSWEAILNGCGAAVWRPAIFNGIRILTPLAADGFYRTKSCLV